MARKKTIQELQEEQERMENELKVKTQKEAPTVEEREAAKAEYLEMVGKCRANTIVNLYD